MSIVRVKRRVIGQREKTVILCPLMIQTYSSGMKGTDLMGRLKVSHKIDRRYSNKFYLRLCFDLLDVEFVNSFIVYTKYKKRHFPHFRRVKT